MYLVSVDEAVVEVEVEVEVEAEAEVVEVVTAECFQVFQLV